MNELNEFFSSLTPSNVVFGVFIAYFMNFLFSIEFFIIELTSYLRSLSQEKRKLNKSRKDF